MKIRDMLKMSLSNLLKRKVRTVLTVLGVVIGVASIVVMVSLGIGLKASTMDDLENYSNLTTITVMAPYDSGSNSRNAADRYLSDKTAESLGTLEHVKNVYPELDTSVLLKFGKYMINTEVYGLPREALENYHIDIAEGALPEQGGELTFFYGNQVLNSYYDPKTGNMPYWDNGTPLEYDLMAKPVATYFDTDAYYQSSNGSADGSESGPPKKYLIPTAGVQAGDESTYTQTSWNVYCDLDALTTELKKVFRTRVIPGQPKMKSGRAYKDIYYSELLVEVDDFNNVTAVQQVISDLGYNAQSDAEWIAQEQRSLNTLQAVLGGIGAVSLLVAAIGIANTMMMSIYERTKEIGIMKVIGCNLHDIRGMFLMEAGYIGLFGGIAGLGFSYFVSFLINTLAGGSESLGITGKISRIPPWLALVSVVFAVAIGMLSGTLPAQRAMKLSPLAAIRNE